MSNGLEVTFLGTGTSTGIPEIGCQCATCQSPDSRDKRSRASILIRRGNNEVVVDCGPDFRNQMLREGVLQLDAILLTHEHYDHVGGLDDVRPFTRHGLTCPIYAEANVIQAIKTRLPYAFTSHPYPGVPVLELKSISPFDEVDVAEDFRVKPIRVMHGRLPILGFKIGDFVYITDCKTLPVETINLLRDQTHTLILNALRDEPHMAHASLREALEIRSAICPTGPTYLTHFAHSFGCHTDIAKRLPEGVFAGYDGLTIKA